MRSKTTRAFIDTVKILTTPRAQDHLRELSLWWKKNRKSSRVSVKSSYLKAVGSIAENPQIGVIYEENPKYRTWALQGTPYRVFYWVDEQCQVVHIVALWSSMRGFGPSLPGGVRFSGDMPDSANDDSDFDS